MQRKDTVTTIRLDGSLRAAMDALYERDGITVSEQIRRALVAFLAAKGITLRTKGGARG